MKTLHKMLLKSFLPVLLFSILFFILILQLLDVFANLWRYLAHDTGMSEILTIAILYLPKCISYSLPAALLFSISFILGILYQNNELIAILGSGTSLFRLIFPLLVIGALLSLGSFLFEDVVVIESYKKKNNLYRTAVHQSISFSHSNVTVLSVDANTIYQADYYNDKRETLTNSVILIRDSEGRFSQRIDADWAEWNGSNWVLHNSQIYYWENDQLRQKKAAIYDEAELAEPPSTFRKVTRDVDEMNAREAKDWVFRLKKAGLPYRETLTKYYKKYFFALSPFIVSLIAVGVGGRFKKNVMLMNLLVSLVVSVVYYVLQMISLILAKSGYIPPMAGASAAFIVFLLAGLFLLRSART